MSSVVLECVELGSPNADYSVIWLHGLGANGHDFEPIVPELNLPDTSQIRFVFPHAPQMPVTINGGAVMPAWYDIRSMNFLDGQDEAGIRHSEQQLVALIEREIKRGVPSDHIVLAGFSQGGAIVLHAGLTCGRPVGGIMALSTYLALPEALAA